MRWPRLLSLSRAFALYATVAPLRFRGRGRNRGEVQSPAGDAEALDVEKAGALRGDAPRRRAFVETVSTTVIALETSRRVLVLPRIVANEFISTPTTPQPNNASSIVPAALHILFIFPEIELPYLKDPSGFFACGISLSNSISFSLVPGRPILCFPP